MFVAEVCNTVSCGQSERDIIFRMLATDRTIFFLSRGTTLEIVRALDLFTISKFLTQVASKSCICMQPFGSILNLFDAVAEV